MNGGGLMSDAGDDASPIGVGGLESMSAGAMLRAARDKRGLHIAALAAAIKVSPRKLEALEADRHGDLPDMTFTRALAQTVCRALKIDAEPVLAKLPQAGDMPKLSQVGGGLNAPFREAAGSRDPGQFMLLRKPAFWATLAVLLSALSLALLPERWMPWHTAVKVPARAASAAASPDAMSPAPAAAPVPAASVPLSKAGVTDASPAIAAPATAAIETVHSAPPSVLAGSTETGAAATGVLAVRTNAESWVEIQDGRGQVLLSRTVQPGETVGLDGPLPMRLTIGNAAVTQVVFRGQPVDLAASTRDNVARLQLP